MSSPSSRICPVTQAPATSSCMRFSVRMNVDLPHPEGPMSAVTCFGSMSRVMSSMAFVRRYHALTTNASNRFTVVPSRASRQPAAAGQETRHDGQQQDDADQRERAGPCPLYGGVEGGGRLGEHE